MWKFPISWSNHFELRIIVYDQGIEKNHMGINFIFCLRPICSPTLKKKFLSQGEYPIHNCVEMYVECHSQIILYIVCLYNIVYYEDELTLRAFLISILSQATPKW